MNLVYLMLPSPPMLLSLSIMAITMMLPTVTLKMDMTVMLRVIGTLPVVHILVQEADTNMGMGGFLAVFAACFTSGLTGVYFEMVLKNSQTDLWIRNMQLSAFSLLPAIVPIVLSRPSDTGLLSSLFENFGVWAWATVAIQVLGGLVTAMVIKYSDNILKGFATSLSIGQA
ncbi:hypothetical protein BDR04DRAFT_1154888 [Suillus decipiens]|nr:hypothetical protein BDR04DRAFT_1154888 [Suillus decipiens]